MGASLITVSFHCGWPSSGNLGTYFVFPVHDLASRFADGRLTTEKLLSATDEELKEMLLAVKGIGPVGPSQ